MIPFDLLLSAVRGVLSNRTRSALTALMVVIGVASVITLVAVGNATTKQVTDQVASLGATAIEVSPGWTENGSGSMTIDDVDALRSNPIGPAIIDVAPTAIGQAKTVLGSTSRDLSVTGTTPDYFSIKNSTLTEGRFLSTADAGRPVAVLDTTAASALAPTGSILGSTVLVGGTAYTVVGVMAEPAGAARLGLSYGGTVYAPIDIVQQTLTGYGNITGAVVSASSSEAVPDAKVQISAILASRAADPASVIPPYFISSDELRNALGGANESLSRMLAGVAAISLIVAGIGVTNVMLLSVRERTREIGVRKALGARRSWIAAQFIVEAAIVSITGGMLGVGVALALSLVPINGVMPLIDSGSIALAAGISITIGLVFGTYPAVRAANLSPLEALRSGT
jgi:putative ABC transport system permease protein